MFIYMIQFWNYLGSDGWKTTRFSFRESLWTLLLPCRDYLTQSNLSFKYSKWTRKKGKIFFLCWWVIASLLWYSIYIDINSFNSTSGRSYSLLKISGISSLHLTSTSEAVCVILRRIDHSFIAILYIDAVPRERWITEPGGGMLSCV